MGRILGIDYGRVRIGVAISDESRFLARPLCCLENQKDLVERLKNELVSYKVDTIVVGLPLLMSGKESSMSQEVKLFADYLGQALSLEVILWDERLTTAQVDRSLKDTGMSRKKRAQISDTLAASLILQSYLDYKRI